MLHTFWLSDSAFDRIQDYVSHSVNSELYIVLAQRDMASDRFAVLIECSERDAVFLRLMEA